MSLIDSARTLHRPWNDESLIARLMTLQATPQKYSYRKIAEILSTEFDYAFTRHAIIGKCHRLQLPYRERLLPMPPKPRLLACRVRPRSIPPPQPPTKLLKPLCPTFLELHNWQCRYPDGDFLFEFCGRLRKSKSFYCPAHHTVVHVPPRAERV